MNTNRKLLLVFIVSSALFMGSAIVAFVLNQITAGTILLVVGLVSGLGYLERRCHEQPHPPPAPVVTDNPVVVIVNPKQTYPNSSKRELR